tara:strand:- start:1586 stop:1861 length:276 start_codon:yes stop_codon:yes gene_type:complete
MNKPLDRDYFKKKANPKAKKGPQLTECCKQDVDRHILNKNKSEDWELIEDYCERGLHSYSNVQSITPVCCKVCGRLINYSSILIDDKDNWK